MPFSHARGWSADTGSCDGVATDNAVFIAVAMPSVFDSLGEPPPKKGKTIKSAVDGGSFDANWTIHVDGLVGSATISPAGRDVALAS